MPETTISAPEHAASVTRMTLGITSARDAVAGSANPNVAILYGPCAASE
jgi:hypothetical protein